MAEEKNFNAAEEKFIDLLSDGFQLSDAVAVLCGCVYNLSGDQVQAMYRNAEILQAIVERSNDKLGQAWGTMWQRIKEQAMLGSVSHSKLLIDFIQNKSSGNFNRLKISFDEPTP
jgi:hypothetical protein